MFLSRCGGYYYLFFSDELGKRRKVSTQARRKADALKFLREFKQQEYDRKKNLSLISLSEFTKLYLEHSGTFHTPKTKESNRTALNQFQKAVGDLPLHKISEKEIEGFLAKTRSQASEWSARKYYISLAAAFEAARRWGHVLSNPFRSVPKPKVPEIQPVYFSKADFAILLEVITDRDLRELVFFAASTGLRLGEILALQWTEVDHVRKVVHVRNSADFTTKSKKNRVVPLTESLSAMLSARQARASNELPFVFQSGVSRWTASGVSHRFKECVRSAKLDERLHFHSLRHSFASWLAADGVSLFAIQKLLGHSSGAVTQIYSHLQPEQLHETVSRLNVTLN